MAVRKNIRRRQRRQRPPRRRHRRHLHRHRGVRRQDRPADLRQGAVDAASGWSTASAAASTKAGSDYASAEPVPARLDRRHQHHPGAHRRQDRAGDHRRLPRRLRDRPHQPARRLQPLFPEARAADRAGAALRGQGARARRRRGGDAARRGRGSPRSATSSTSSASKPSRSCSSTATPTARTRRAPRRFSSKRHPGMFVSASHELSQEYREFERCSTVAANAYIGPKVRRYIGEIDEHIRKAGFHGSFLIVQSTGGLYESEQAQTQCVRMLEIGPGGRRDRHAGALPHARHRERHRLRHGRHHGEGRRHLQGRGADHGRGADRRLRQGAAGADRHDGHFRGRHRRRLDRARRRRRACASARRAPARSPGRPATASAARSRP